jgi:DNA-binding MarR family transcriptional regulator
MSVEQMIQSMRSSWDQDNLEAAFTVIRLYRGRDQLYSRARAIMEQYDLNPGEFDALASLRKMGPPYKLTPSNICQANLVSSGGLTKVLNNLEKRGYITREIDSKDLRSRIVKLTKSGKSLIEEAFANVLKSHQENLSRIFTKKEREEFDRLLIKLQDA